MCQTSKYLFSLKKLGFIKKTYTVPEIAETLQISVRKAYLFCNETNEFKVMRLGKSIRVHKNSFDEWFSR